MRKDIQGITKNASAAPNNISQLTRTSLSDDMSLVFFVQRTRTLLFTLIIGLVVSTKIIEAILTLYDLNFEGCVNIFQ